MSHVGALAAPAPGARQSSSSSGTSSTAAAAAVPRRGWSLPLLVLPLPLPPPCRRGLCRDCCCCCCCRCCRRCCCCTAAAAAAAAAVVAAAPVGKERQKDRERVIGRPARAHRQRTCVDAGLGPRRREALGAGGTRAPTPPKTQRVNHSLRRTIQNHTSSRSQPASQPARARAQGKKGPIGRPLPHPMGYLLTHLPPCKLTYVPSSMLWVPQHPANAVFRGTGCRQ